MEERIPMQARGKRPHFFPDSSADETVTMILELMSEVWALRERMYALERVAEDSGLELTSKIEEWRPDEQQAAALDEQRMLMIRSVLRSIEAKHVPGQHLRRALDAVGHDPEGAPVDDGQVDGAMDKVA